MIDGVQTASDYVRDADASSEPTPPTNAQGNPAETANTHGDVPREKTCSYGIWIFLCQVYALSWKQYLIKKRRPLSTVFEILAPALMLMILVYGTKLSPVVPIPAFQYDSIPQVTTNNTIPATTDPVTEYILQLLESANLYNQNNPESYFQTAFLPLLSSQNASLASQLSAVMYANSAAAAPFIVPGFDTYVSMMLQGRIILSNAGMKTLEHLDPLLWHVMHMGKLAFTPPSSELRFLIQYLTATTTSFGSLVLCPQGDGSTACDGFASVAAAEAAAAALGEPIWAVVVVDALDFGQQTFSYTIRMNESLVPATSSVIDRFPQGLGAAYAKYIYGGFTTIQFELNEFFRRSAVAYAVAQGTAAAPTIGFGVIPLFESVCNDIVNATVLAPNAALFAQTHNATQLGLLSYLLSLPRPPDITVYPFPNVSTLYPCYAGMTAYCSTFNTSDAIAACLSTHNESVGACNAAIVYAQTCGATVSQACGVSVRDFFHTVPNPVASTECWGQLRTDPTCGSTSLFGMLMTETADMTVELPCNGDSVLYCGTGTCNPNMPNGGTACGPNYGCLKQRYDAHQNLSPLCEAVVAAVAPCADDVQTICPFDPNQDALALFPTLCMHLQRTFLSETCRNTVLFDRVEYVYADAAVAVAVPNPVYYCRMAHQVSLAFSDGVAAGAFPARAYGQNQFYANSGALIGLVVALSYLYPFTAHVRLIVQERAKRQRLFMMLVGVHHSAILVTYTIIGFVTVFASSLFSTIVLGWVFPEVSTDALFSLVFTYGFSLIGLASFVAAFFSSTRHSGAIAPFVLFLFAIPAFVVVGDVDFITYVLPPSVCILAADLFVGYSQSSATAAVFADDLKTATSALFGLAILYLLLALLVEQYRVLSTSIGMVGRFSRYLTDRCFGAYRYVVRPFRKTRIYHRIHQQVPTGDEAEGIELMEDNDLHGEQDNAREQRLSTGGGYGYENFDEGTAAAPSAHLDSLRYSIGGVDQDGTTVDGAGAPSPGSSSRRYANQRQHNAWRVGVAMHNLTLSYASGTSKLRAAIRNATAVLYRNRLNCIIGGTGSGKSTLIRILMGEWAPDSGHFTIDDGPPTSYNRQNLGVCLQQDVSWDQLTVAEHIELVQLVKGCINIEFMKEETNTLLGVLNLEDKRNCHADTLSYGMLRKLNVAMAFAGGSRFIFLDEPTASIDPLSRKAVWHLLASNVHNRCITVTTSYVEELDDAHHLLILNEGSVRCAGTPQYLKRALGSSGGYILSVSRGHGFSATAVLSTVASHLPHTQLVNNVGQELCFRVHRADTTLLGEALSAVSAIPGVSSVAVSDHRLDELFMRVTREQGVANDVFSRLTTDASQVPTAEGGETAGTASPYQRLSSDAARVGSVNAADEDSDAEQAQQPPHASVASGNSIGSERERSGRLQRGTFAMFLQCYSAILTKRFSVGIATFLPSTLLFLLPLICISLAMNLLDASDPSYPALRLDTSAMYGDNDVLVGVAASNTTDWLQALAAMRGTSTQLVLDDAWQTSVAVSATLFRQMNDHDVPRYGAFVINDTFINFTVENFLQGINGSADMFVGNKTVLWHTDTILHNTSSPHALPGFLNNLGILRVARSLPGLPLASISVTNRPLPYVNGVVSTSTLIISIISSILLLVPFTFFPAMFVSAIVKERDSGMLDVEYSSSMTPAAYWLATFTWNMLVFGLFSIFSIVLYMSSEKALIHGLGEAMYTWFVLLLYGACVNSISYVLSKCFRRHTTAQNGVTMFHFTCGFVLVVAANAVNLLPDTADTQSAKDTNEGFMKLFRFLPTYALGESFIKLSLMPLAQYLHMDLDLYNTLTESIKLMFLFPLYLGGLILYEQYGRLEVRHWWKATAKVQLRRLTRGLALKAEVNPWEDDQLLMVDDEPTIAAERARALSPSGLNAVDVWRRYDKPGHNLNAVQNVALHVGKERMVIMGPNGAGKSTLLRCMAGVEPTSSGYVAHRGFNMSLQTTAYWAARASMGFAGDLQGINEHVSPYLLLHVVADLRGIRVSRHREQHIQYLLTTMGLWGSRNRSCKHLSPVVQRRVAVALSLVGFPETVILDEPTTGLDPVGRRQFWATLQALPASTSLLMSSQWSEDVDMIASRVLLLDGGKARQVGPVDELRSRARHGGVVVTIYWRHELQLAQDGSRRGHQKEAICNFMHATWSASTIVEEAMGMLRFRIAATDTLDAPLEGSRSVPAFVRTPEAPRDAFAGLDDLALNTATPSSTPTRPVEAAPTTSQTAEAPATIQSIFERISAQRDEWLSDALWTSRPSSPTASSPVQGDDANSRRGSAGSVASSSDDVPPPPFEFDVAQATFGMMLDVAVGTKSTTVQHIRRMLNMPSVLRLRESEQDA